jgi:hypothetical protein
LAAHVTTALQRPPDQIPGVFNAPGAQQRRGVEGRLQVLPAKLARPLGELNRPGQECPIEIVRDHAGAKLHQDPLREGRLRCPQTPQDQLPSLIDTRRHDRLGIADLVIRLEQHHRRQQRRWHRCRAAWLVDRGQFCLECVVE